MCTPSRWRRSLAIPQITCMFTLAKAICLATNCLGAKGGPLKCCIYSKPIARDTIAMQFHRASSGRNIEFEKKIKFERFDGSAVCVFETIERFGKLFV